MGNELLYGRNGLVNAVMQDNASNRANQTPSGPFGDEAPGKRQAVAVRVLDGMVFAADSASSISHTAPGEEPRISNVYQHGIKVFNLFKRVPVAGMTCGLGNFGTASIASLAKDFRYRMSAGDDSWRLNPKDYSIEEVAGKAKRYFFDDKYSALDPKPADAFEFWIGGYPSDMEAPYELWKVFKTSHL